MIREIFRLPTILTALFITCLFSWLLIYSEAFTSSHHTPLLDIVMIVVFLPQTFFASAVFDWLPLSVSLTLKTILALCLSFIPSLFYGRALVKIWNIKRLIIFLLVMFFVGLIILRIFASDFLRNPAIKTAREIAAELQLRRIEYALEMFRADCSRYPTPEEGLEVLISNPGIQGWNGPYLSNRKIPIDHWGKSYLYYFEGTKLLLGSSGRDKRLNTRDDIIVNMNN